MTFETDPSRYIITMSLDDDEVIPTLQTLLRISGVEIISLEPSKRISREAKEAPLELSKEIVRRRPIH
jgi:hypothetical protein